MRHRWLGRRPDSHETATAAAVAAGVAAGVALIVYYLARILLARAAIEPLPGGGREELRASGRDGARRRLPSGRG